VDDDAGEWLGREDVREEEAGVENVGSEQAAELNQGGGVVRIGHERPSLSVEDGGTPSIGSEVGLSWTSPGVEKSYDSVSAIHFC
jgi:hypothetical protein